MDYGDVIRQKAYSGYQSEAATQKQLMVVNMLFGHVTDSREVKLYILGGIFNRKFTTSKELSKSEAKALIDLGFTTDWQPIPAFVEYLTDLTMEVIF